jgi:peptidyl-tRNA hydrolase, PTH1 family
MNVSGAGVKKTFNAWAGRREGGKMVVLQDELELAFGALKVRKGWASARGHNGVKSIQQNLSRETEWWRIGVGVGRPESREPDDVANFVLSRMKPREREILDSKGEELVEVLKKVAEG